MNQLALWLGWALMACGGLALVAFAVGLALDYSWRKTKDAMAWKDIRTAIREWNQRKNPEGETS